MEKVILKVAGNVTYNGFTYNSRLQVEYKHTGFMYFKSKKKVHFTTNKEIAENWKKNGVKVIVESGYYYIERVALLNYDGSVWYINNPGDSYIINKCSKFWNKIHKELSNQIISWK